MAAGAKRIDKDHYLFREGDPPDAMYVIKSGKFAVVKTKNNSEIMLAELGPGSMVGEMAFFDNKPRSASVKAVKESDVITLPYKALHAQFATMPEWTRAIMRTVNDHLRNANKRIKELEKATTDEEEIFPPHTITKLTAILNFVGLRYGEPTNEGLSVPASILRNYTIQVFGEATHKMQKLMASLAELELMRVEDVGEGRQKILVLDDKLLFRFTEWYNDWLFKKDADRVLIKDDEVKILRGLLEFGKKLEPDDKGMVKVNLTEIQNESMRVLGFLLRVEDTHGLVENELLTEHMSEPNGICSKFSVEEYEKLVPFWTIVYALRRVKK